MTNKRNRFYQIGFAISTIICIGLLAFMGITAVQKSMRLNVGFSAVPSIKVLIQIEDQQAEGGYRTIFRNDANTQIGDGLRISGNTLTFTESFANAEPNIGASFVLKFTNLMTNSGLKVSEVGSSASADPTYVTMKASGNGVNTATMTISGSEVSTLQLLFGEYNVYTVSFGGGVTNSSVEIGSGDAYSTTLTVNNGYDIPSSVSITVGGVAIDSNSYTYTPSTGALTINAGVVNGDVVITATATAKSYTITYTLGSNVVNHPSNPATYTVEDTITLQAPIKDGGYMFGGWTGSNGATPETSVTIPQGSTGNKTYTVSSWTLGDYTLMEGQDLNAKIKQTANNNTTATYSTQDSTVTSIIFGTYSDYTSTVGAWTGGIAVDIDGEEDEDLNADGYIRMFLTNSNENCYILSDGNIYANAELGDSRNSMFSNFRGVTSFAFDNFNTSNVTNMTYMFQRCSGLTSLDLSNFNTSNVTDMTYMFAYCERVTSLNVSNFNTSNVTNMSNMFNYCRYVTSLNLSNFNTSNVRDMGSMFYGCLRLTELDLSSFNTSNVTNMSKMFSGCSDDLTSITFPINFGSAATNMSSMFTSCSKLTSLDLSNFNTSNVTNMSSMFSSCSKLTSLTLGNNFNTSNVTNMGSMFSSCRGLTSITFPINFGSAATNMYQMFATCTSLTSLDLSNFNTSNVTSMVNMFMGCSGLTNLTLGSSFDTSNVTNMSQMFYGCSGLTVLGLGHFNTSKVTDMSYMFYNCSNLERILVVVGSGAWSTDAVTNSTKMFYGCTKLPNFDSNYLDKTNAHTNSGGYLSTYRPEVE